MRRAFLKVLPKTSPGLTADEVRKVVIGHLPQDLFPGGSKVGWWTKAVELDLEARGVIVREKPSRSDCARHDGVARESERGPGPRRARHRDGAAREGRADTDRSSDAADHGGRTASTREPLRARQMTRSRANEYRRLAQECFAAARSVAGELRAALIERAEYWLRLAKQQDEATDLGQPVMQQRQQDRPKDEQ
jgi:hypothetical protein